MSTGDLQYVLTTWGTDRPELQHLRREVFVLEQGVPEELEWDDTDPVSVHVLATVNREPVGTGRLSPTGKIGRMAVKAGLRGRGVGSTILKLLLQEACRRSLHEVWLHAQLSAVSFYEKHGFRCEGEVFDEAGIPHRRMKLALE
ncbi:MAG: GNAT family N-acetyltransferase [Gammaproteobacteria bacterium]|nr:GNAT family N-acetyltransferase [Gammaproteobacteria bacterium]